MRAHARWSEGRWSEGLTGPALEIAATTASPLRVDAGPGTGKTFALMRRVSRLLEEGLNPERIFVGTFTRTSATDLINSLAELGADGAEAVHAGTIHGFCFRILSRDIVLEQTRRVPRPLLEFELRFLLEDLSRPDFGGIRARRKRLEAFTAAWARLHSDEPGWPRDPLDQLFQDDLMAWFRFHQSMHIGELVWLALQYLRENPTSEFRSAFDHVLVDEYQDLNRTKQELLNIIVGAGDFTVVGDEDQSIYSFRYAHPQGIRDFGGDHPGTHDIPLRECRRCPHIIITMANSLVGRNQFRLPRVLEPRDGSPAGEVYVVQWTTMQKEARGLARFVRQRIADQQVQAGRILILSPRRQFGYAVRDELVRQGIAAHSFFLEEELEGDPKKVDRCQPQEAFTLLTLLANRSDVVSLRCWCGFGTSTLNKGAWAQLRQHCERTGETPTEALQRVSEGDLQLPYVARLVPKYRSLVQRLAALEDLRGQDLVNSLFPPGEDWADGLRQLSRGPAEEGCDARGLHEALRTAITQPELPTDVDYVRVMSLHKAKGLTADLVVVMGCLNGLIPFIDDDLPIEEQVHKLEEQRRLFYVALTRARCTLVLSSVTRLPRDLAYKMRVRVRGGGRDWARTIPSPFLLDLGPERPDTVVGAAIL
jgi:DNA helicase II / ATP-dependent DNA helicase PcrA